MRRMTSGKRAPVEILSRKIWDASEFDSVSKTNAPFLKVSMQI